MKEKILATIKTKHASLIKDQGLTDKALLGIASMLAITLKEETEIETVVSSDGVVDALKGVQGEVDSRVAEAVKKAKSEKKPEGGGGEDPKPKTDTNDGDVPAWAKALIDSNKSLTDELANIKKQTTAKSLTDKVVSTLKEKKVDEDYLTDMLDGREFDSEETANSFITKVEAGWAKLKQKQANDLLGGAAENPFIANQEGESSFISNLTAAVKSAETKG